MPRMGLGVAHIPVFDMDSGLAPKPGSEPWGDGRVQEELAREG